MHSSGSSVDSGSKHNLETSTKPGEDITTGVDYLRVFKLCFSTCCFVFIVFMVIVSIVGSDSFSDAGWVSQLDSAGSDVVGCVRFGTWVPRFDGPSSWTLDLNLERLSHWRPLDDSLQKKKIKARFWCFQHVLGFDLIITQLLTMQ
ncbi:uncharacterized protein [Physcomitrium patens]|uniref:uncharacterized protein isoform X2 n=1 Tax=Physcomitrium patens TaxID=3218 RepID=UPI003CCD7C61